MKCMIWVLYTHSTYCPVFRVRTDFNATFVLFLTILEEPLFTKHISTTPHTSMWNGLRKILLHLLFSPHIFINSQLLFLGFQEGRRNERIDLLIQKHRLLAVKPSNLECFLQFIFFSEINLLPFPGTSKPPSTRSPYLHAMEWSLNQGK